MTKEAVMETPKVKCRICTNDRGHSEVYRGQSGFPTLTPATAIPDEVLVKVREGLEQIARAYGDTP